MPYGITFNLDQEQAVFIKKLRVDNGYSWRAVARDVSEVFHNLKDIGGSPVKSGNQIHGIALCDAAMNMLNETVEDGWN